MTSQRFDRNHYGSWLECVDDHRAHLNAMRHHCTMLRESTNPKAAGWIAETEADIKATLIRLSDLGAI